MRIQLFTLIIFFVFRLGLLSRNCNYGLLKISALRYFIIIASPVLIKLGAVFIKYTVKVRMK